jgi:cation diffusion facilitator family transporter
VENSLRERSQEGSVLVLWGVGVNATLAVIKVIAGVWGHSNALLADGLESALDVVSSVLIWGALLYAGKPPDEEHPYGHGKLESLAGVVGAIFLIGAGGSVALHSGLDLWRAHFHEGGNATMPATWTLAVLAVVILTKEIFYHVLMRTARRIGSSAMQADAYHHRSDAITSIAAFLGISIALVGGPHWRSADDWAALFSCALILRNGFGMLRRGVGEVIDEQSPELAEQILQIACAVPDVASAEKCRVRKSGLTLIADLHIRVPGELSVFRGHEISHEVKDRLMEAGLHLSDVTVHLEPADSLS